MRYLALTDGDREEMLQELGLASTSDVYNEIPSSLIKKDSFKLPKHQTELVVETNLKNLANKNINTNEFSCFIGAGSYKHHVPSSVDHIIQRAEFLTSYTPYQPEISQGTLISIFEFQTYIANLTGQDVANASMYDGATSLVEAIAMAKRIKKKEKFIIANEINADYSRVISGYYDNDDIFKDIKFDDDNIFKDSKFDDIAAIIVQTPDFNGTPHSLEKYKEIADKLNALLIVSVTEIISLGLLPAPELADIVTGEASSLGVCLNYGGPHLGFFACKKEYTRQIPGRICGKTVDKQNKRAFVLTLNAREQHIRRHKATSNICSNQGLNMLAFTIHLSLLGEKGFKDLAKLNHYKATLLYKGLAKISGLEIQNTSYFNEFTFKLKNISADDFLQKMLDKKIFAGFAITGDKVLVAATEALTNQEIEDYIKCAEELC
ncbi:aminomethyl-transferring glycine dehydrogenase subunit GcvPA [Rickettsiales bacterium]|nr:aminomethyl-transferring glycine dehydrogenase subunit GcvPA [Rickettsiales bacterium]